MKKLSPLFLFLLCFAISQAQPFSFQHFGTEEGLSQSFVSALLKDQSGYIWAGTQDGLNRFDGYTFDQFYARPNDSTALSNNYILSLFESPDGKIWIGTNGGGLCQFDPEQERFYTFNFEEASKFSSGHKVIQCLQGGKANDLWLGTNAGLLHFDLTTKRFQTIAFPKTIPKRQETLYSLLPIDNHRFLVGGLAQLYFLDLHTHRLSEAKLPYPIEGGFHDLALDKNQSIWAATGKGLLNIQTTASPDSMELLQHYQQESKAEHGLLSNYISTTYFDEAGMLWLGTNAGIHFFNPTHPERGFRYLQHDPEKAASLSSNLIYDLLVIEAGQMWAATQKGVNQFNSKQSGIQTYFFRDLQLQCGHSVHGMMESQNGDLWMGTEDGLAIWEQPLNHVDKTSWKCFQKSNTPQMGDDFLVSISPGTGNHQWIALRRGGFAKASYQNQQLNWQNFKLPAGAYSNIGTNDILELDAANTWIASSGLGLWHWNQENGKFTNFQKQAEDSTGLSGNYIFQLMLDHKKNLWLATADGGLCKMDIQTLQFDCFTHDPTNPSSISSNMVLSVFEDRQQRIWACTSDGLNLLEQDGHFLHWTPEDGLPNNVIYGMLEDPKGYLWLSTNKGIAKIDTQNSPFKITSYNRGDGLLKNEFNQHAFFARQNGSLIFGSEGGLSIIDPLVLQDYEVLPKVVFSDFKLFNNSVAVGSYSNGFYLKKSINQTQQIQLPHHQNFIAFEFTGINFVQSNKNTYAYKMEDLDEDWVYCGQRRYAAYPNLSPGKYQFKVKAANHDGHWNSKLKSIEIIIRQPPWKTAWAYLLYAITIAACVWVFLRYHENSIRKIEQAKQEERASFRQRAARDFHDEAGNQMTKIGLMTEMAKRKAGQQADLYQLLGQVEYNLQSLRNGMRDFIWVLDANNDNLFETLQRLAKFGSQLFEFSPIYFQVEGIHPSFEQYPLNSNERRHLLMIFKEAINNCLKYSKAQNALLKVIQQEDGLEILLKDDGIGFNPQTQMSGNGLKNMQFRASKIKADLRIVSQKGQGTTIALKCRITQMGD